MWPIVGCLGQNGNRTTGGELPEVLVEEIVTKMPFPHILKARQLSKEWKSKFLDVVGEGIVNWPEFYPAYFCKRKSRVEGYDSRRLSVKRMGSKKVKTDGLDTTVTCCGSLMAAVGLVTVQEAPFPQPMAMVINLFTGERRKIPCPVAPSNEDGDCVMYSNPILTPVGRDHYELIIWFSLVSSADLYTRTGVNVYSSASETWKQLQYADHLGGSQSGAYLDGSLYCIPDLLKTARSAPTVVRYDSTGAISLIDLPAPEEETRIEWLYQSVVRCGSRIFAVVFEFDYRVFELNVKILEINTRSSGIRKLTTCPLNLRAPLVFNHVEHPVVASSNALYILDTTVRMGKTLPCIKRYDVNVNVWKIFNSHRKCWGHRNLFVFEPGLNPFVKP